MKYGDIETRAYEDRRSSIVVLAWGITMGLVNRKIAKRPNFVTDQLNDVENTYDYHLLMVFVEAVWTLTADHFNTGEDFKY